MDAGMWDVETVLPVVVGAVALFIIVLVLNKFIKRIFHQSSYLDVLRAYAGKHGLKKPMSKWTFIGLEIAGVFLCLLFMSAFFQNAMLTFGVILVIVIVAVLVAVKFYVPPLKTFALKEHLAYEGDVVSGQYKGRGIVVKMDKDNVDIHLMSFSERDRQVKPQIRLVTASMELDADGIHEVRYENGKVIVEPQLVGVDLSGPEQMLGEMPPSDNVRLSLTTINGKRHLTLEKIIIGFVFVAEFYYLRDILDKILIESARGQA